MLFQAHPLQIGCAQPGYCSLQVRAGIRLLPLWWSWSRDWYRQAAALPTSWGCLGDLLAAKGTSFLANCCRTKLCPNFRQPFWAIFRRSQAATLCISRSVHCIAFSAAQCIPCITVHSLGLCIALHRVHQRALFAYISQLHPGRR